MQYPLCDSLLSSQLELYPSLRKCLSEACEELGDWSVLAGLDVMTIRFESACKKVRDDVQIVLVLFPSF